MATHKRKTARDLRDLAALKEVLVNGFAASLAEKLRQLVFDLAAELAINQANTMSDANIAAQVIVFSALSSFAPEARDVVMPCTLGVKFNTTLLMVAERLPKTQLAALHDLDQTSYYRLITSFKNLV